ncbi:pyrimidine oxygenase [Rhodococcus rhodochrous J38]|uniref:LLM class flavin-dependent oxidoreductase n=1 Tax=Rhodococcus rhodochrous TaxID=1829 RepID=UPI0011AB172C|nr:LLM class flavin-dependent oxidoreductase [Rhodococcus rhodochrous]TWH41959.1 pyrimidine oxygenase [Rhodococcus rhodochrous J38]
MKLGLFLPTGNNGWISSETAPHYMPTYRLNRDIVRLAENAGFTIGLGMISFRGYGGVTEHWDYTSEPMTQTAAVLASTDSMQIFASVGVLSVHPAMAARMAATIDDVAPGRFGVNITTGWNSAEYAQMGMWPGDDYFGYRYDYASEWAQVFRDLVETGRSDFRGKFFQMDDCRMGMHPAGKIQISAAGSSPRGREFAGQFADFNFTTAIEPGAVAEAHAQMSAAAAANGREVRILTTRSVIIADTDEDAAARIEHYNSGSDIEALTNERGQYAQDSSGTMSKEAVNRIRTHQAVDPNSPRLFAGSARTVAEKLNLLASEGGLAGVMLSFDDFRDGVGRFGKEVVPLLDFDITH